MSEPISLAKRNGFAWNQTQYLEIRMENNQTAVPIVLQQVPHVVVRISKICILLVNTN